MKKLTLILSLLVAMVTTAIAQTTYEQKIFKFKVTACNETPKQDNGVEGGTDYILDENNNTFYHSDWKSSYEDGTGINKGKDGLQAFMIELPMEYSDITKITYAGRSDNNSSGWARKVRIYTYETLPDVLSSTALNKLTYTDKQNYLKRDNTVLGPPAFDNYEDAWKNNRDLKTATFATPQTAKYILFVMDEGSDAWLTCSQFNIYRNAQVSIVEHKPYALKITNADEKGDWYLDIRNGINSSIAKTITKSTNPIPAYFTINDGLCNINASPWPYKEFLTVNAWDATPLSQTPHGWYIHETEGTISLLQSTYFGGGDRSKNFIGKQSNATVYYTDKDINNALKIQLVELDDLTAAKENARILLKKVGIGYPAVGSDARTALETAMNANDATVENVNAAIEAYKATYDEASEIANVVLPETSKIYRIVSAVPGFAERHVRKAICSQSMALKWEDYDATDMSQLWAVQSFTSDGSNTIKIVNVKDGMYPQSTVYQAPVKINHISNEGSWDYLGEGQFRIKANKLQGLHANNHGGGTGNASNIINYNAEKNSASAWYLEEVDITAEILNQLANSINNVYLQSYLIGEKSSELEAAVATAKAAKNHTEATKELLGVLNNTEFKYIDEGYFYMKSRSAGNYAYNDNNENLSTAAKSNKSIFKLTKANNGTFYVQTDGGLYAQGVSESADTQLGPDKKEYTINYLETDKDKQYYVLRPLEKNADREFWHESWNNVVGWSVDAANTQWAFEPLTEEELSKIYTVKHLPESATITYSGENYTGSTTVLQTGGFYMLNETPSEADFTTNIEAPAAPMENVFKIKDNTISLFQGYNNKNNKIFTIRCVSNNAYARYHSECQLSESDETNMLTYEHNGRKYESLFLIEEGTDKYAGFYTIRPFVALDKYVYNLGTADANSKVAIKEAPTDGVLTGAYYWKISSFGEYAGNITPYHEGGNTGDDYGWNKRGSYDGKNHIGYWKGHNDANDNKWYVKTMEQEFIPHTLDNSVLGYATYESVKEYIPYTEVVNNDNFTTLHYTTFAIVLPKVGSYYTLQNEKSSKYMTGNTENITIEESADESKSIFYVDEGYSLMSYVAGRYLDTKAKGYSAIGTKLNGKFTKVNVGYKENTLAYSNNDNRWTYGGGDTAGGGTNGLDQGSGEVVPDNTAYNWILTKVSELPVTITEAGYASFHAPVAVELPDGITAHTITINTELRTARLSDGFTKIPANTGVILAGAPNTYSLKIIDEEVALEGENILEGTVAATYITEESYVLANPTDENGNPKGIGLYLAKTEGQTEPTFLNNSHKAYLPKSVVPTVAQMSAGFRFSFGGTTDIEEVETESENVKAIYDLTGRKLESIAGPGIYIIDGKKIIVK